MSARFVPSARLGDVVVADAVQGSGFARVWHGAHPGDGGAPAFPVAVHTGPLAESGDDAHDFTTLGDEVGYVARRLRLKVLLQGHGVPRVLGTVEETGEGRLVGFVEAHAGDLSLRRLMQVNTASGGQLPIGVALRIARQLALPFVANEAASTGVCLGAGTGNVFIDDCGVVRSLIEPRPGLTPTAQSDASGVLQGDLLYLAPEEMRDREVGPAPSMFSLGMVLFELVAGQYPFPEARRQSVIEVVRAVLQEQVPPLSAWRRDAPAPVAWLVERLTRKEPTRRFSAWAEVLAALDATIERTERATDADVAAFCSALCPEEMALTRERREEIAMTRLDELALPALPHRRPGAPPLEDAPPVAVADADWNEATPPEVDAAFIGADRQPMWHLLLATDVALDDWPLPHSTTRRLLLVDAVPVSQAAWARFCAETGRPTPSSWGGPLPPPELADTPIVDVRHEDASAYARHFGKELPTMGLWEAAVAVLGPARLQVGAVWEWTSTTMFTGHAVMGGRFRDAPDVVSTGASTSWQERPAGDVGFRCIIRS